MKRRKKRHTLFMIILILLLLAAAYILISLWLSVNFLTVREFTAEIGAEHPVRTVVISDLHDHRFGEDNERLAEKIRETAPDLIFMDGDMLNGEAENAEVPAALIRELKDTAPVYYALGNHEIDYMENGHPELTEELERGNVRLCFWSRRQ